MPANTNPFGAGTGSAGTMPAGTSGSLIGAIDSAESIAENRIRLYFNTAPKFENLETCDDASELASYTLTPTEGTVDRLGNATRPVNVVAVESISALEIDLVLDRPMSSFFGSTYTLMVDGLVAASDGTVFSPQTFFIIAQFKGIPSPIPENTVNNRDIANPQSLQAIYDPLPIDGQPENSLLGRYAIDSRGDVALDEGIVSYKKRVFRRLTTKKGAFAHLPGYGVTFQENIKQLNATSIRNDMAVDARDQIMQEPETVEAQVNVRVEPSEPGVVFFDIRAKTTLGRDVSMSVPVAADQV